VSDDTALYDLPAEKAVIGGMLLAAVRDARNTVDQAAVMADVEAAMRPADYFRPAHRVIHEVIADLYNRGDPADTIAVAAELLKRGETGVTGGPLYLHEAIAAVPAAATAGYYARIVADLAVRRRLVETGERIAEMGRTGDGDAAEIAARAEQALASVVPAPKESTASDSAELFREAAERYENPPDLTGLVTVPWLDVRALVPYLRPGELITIGATPGAGKSVTAADLLRHAGLHLDLRSVLYTLEMARSQVMDRIVSAETSVPLAHFQKYAVDDTDWHRIAKSSERFMAGRFTIDDSPRTSLTGIRADLRRAGRDPYQLLIVDYLQLMRPGTREQNREREVAALAEGLKAMAGDFGIPVVMLAQLNRNVVSRADRTPTKADLRESGAIENASDVVILIHRPDIYEPDSTRPGEADFIVDKNRSGSRGTATVLFQGEYGRFVGMNASEDGWSASRWAS
jgi:replicative DNA helicase